MTELLVAEEMTRAALSIPCINGIEYLTRLYLPLEMSNRYKSFITLFDSNRMEQIDYPTAKEEEEGLITDFSTIFKRKTNKQFKPSQTKPTKNWLLEIPTRIDITLNDLKERKVFDTKRWMCISRPQYPKSCGISSVVSVWNYLYSRIGTGDLEPLSAEKGMELLGIANEGESLSEVDFGGFSGN